MSKKGSINNAVASEELQRYYDLLKVVMTDDMIGLAREFEKCYGVELIDKNTSNFFLITSLLGDAANKIFGIPELIEATGDSDIEKKLDALCKEITCKSEPESHADEEYFCSAHLKRKQARRKRRRASEVKTRTRAIQLGSAAVYSEDGTLARGEGIVSKKLRKAAHEGPSHVQAENVAKIKHRTRHLVRLAEVYEDYTLLYRGRYFKDDKVLISEKEDSEEVKADAGQVEVKGKKSKTKLYDTDSLHEEQLVQKDDDPKNVRRNMHPVSNSGHCKEPLTVDRKPTSADFSKYFKTYIHIPYMDCLPHGYGYL